MRRTTELKTRPEFGCHFYQKGDIKMGERVNLSGNSISRVWREGDSIIKCQPKYLADNEHWALKLLLFTDYVPRVISRHDDETVIMEFVESEPVTDSRAFMSHYWRVLHVLEHARLRHGDLTEYSVLVRNNRPIIIDWAESRTWDDPRPDKRIEGDAYWLKKTMEKLCQDSESDKIREEKISLCVPHSRERKCQSET
jgi:RIO-like serine/threonine protein kinase